MELRKICEDTSDMGMWELAHNFVFIKDKEAWYRDFEREISALNLMREIIGKHGDPERISGLSDQELNDTLMDDLQYGTDDLDGVFATLYMALWGMAEVRGWLKQHEESGLPAIKRPEALQEAVAAYGTHAQVDMAIEEMSELTKALCKERRCGFGQLTDRKRAPLVEFGIEEGLCGLYCQYEGILAPSYETSCRDGCWMCHNQGVNQLRLLRRNYPELWALLLKWDTDSPVYFKANGHTVHDYDRRFQMEDERLLIPGDPKFKWAMLDGEYQLKLF